MVSVICSKFLLLHFLCSRWRNENTLLFRRFPCHSLDQHTVCVMKSALIIFIIPTDRNVSNFLFSSPKPAKVISSTLLRNPVLPWFRSISEQYKMANLPIFLPGLFPSSAPHPLLINWRSFAPAYQTDPIPPIPSRHTQKKTQTNLFSLG